MYNKKRGQEFGKPIPVNDLECISISKGKISSSLDNILKFPFLIVSSSTNENEVELFTFKVIIFELDAFENEQITEKLFVRVKIPFANVCRY